MILDEIVRDKKILIENKLNNKKEFPVDEFFIIGEFKMASPSKGIIEKNFSVQKILKAYEDMPIDIYSVLTEEKYFMGSMEYLAEVKKSTNRPVLRKDFIIDPYEIYESKVMGADIILLIVAVLGEKIGEYYTIAKSIGLEVLVEVHNEDELKIALKYDCKIIGINNRDLRTFKVDINVTKRLVSLVPKGKIIISESGISSLDDLEIVKSFGVNGVLIGESFMRNYENGEFVKEFKKRFS